MCVVSCPEVCTCMYMYMYVKLTEVRMHMLCGEIYRVLFFCSRGRLTITHLSKLSGVTGIGILITTLKLGPVVQVRTAVFCGRYVAMYSVINQINYVLGN